MMKASFTGCLVWKVLTLLLAGGGVHGETTEVLEYDENRRLNRNSILYQNTERCKEKIQTSWSNGNTHSDARNLIPMPEDLYQQLRTSSNKNTSSTASGCMAICVDKGLAENLLPYPVPFYVYSEDSSAGNAGEDNTAMTNWIEKCKGVEVGFISYWPTEATVYWVNSAGKRHKVGTLKHGERNTVWQSSFLGHVFEVCDKDTDELILRHTMMYSAHVVVGIEHQKEAINRSIHSTFNFQQVSNKVKQAMSHEWTRCNRVQRTFTPLGFSKGSLPKDVWGSISAYQYNNKNNVFVEEWSSGGKGYFVNWWEVTPYMIGIPWNLKRYWQSRMREMVATWIGGDIQLENTDIYGIRRYEDGARLLTHVDRESTHAVSLIVNVDQVAMREPWSVEIYDFAGRLHEINMEPGEIVYYESARCLHGRMKHLKGASYSNLFAHYRPLDDPQWYTRTNPDSAPDQVLSLNSCQQTNNVYDCDGVKLPYLSPSGEVVKGSNDLYSYWERIGQAEEERVTALSRQGEL